MSAAAPAPAIRVGSIVENLQVAFNGESNARARYLAFAQRADEEGYAPVASLLRAAAKAEEVHAGNHAFVLRTSGVEPVAAIEAPEVKTTRENLAAALVGEIYERDVMYPAFLAKARADANEPAANTFFLAKEVEAEHARLFAAALAGLDGLRGQGLVYYVCPVCGFTSTTLDFPDCAVCGGLAEDFLEVR